MKKYFCSPYLSWHSNVTAVGCLSFNLLKVAYKFVSTLFESYTPVSTTHLPVAQIDSCCRSQPMPRMLYLDTDWVVEGRA